MAWCRQATSHYLNQCWPRSRTPYDVTRPQCVKVVDKRCLARFEFQMSFDLIFYVTKITSREVSSDFRMIWLSVTLFFVAANNPISRGDETGIIRPSADVGGIVENVSSTGLPLPAVGLRTETLGHYKLVTQQTNSGVYQRIGFASSIARSVRVGAGQQNWWCKHQVLFSTRGLWKLYTARRCILRMACYRIYMQ